MPLPQPTSEEQLEQESLPDFSLVENRVFSVGKDGSIYIGKEKISPEVKDVLLAQARYIESSQLWEVFNAAIINEASNLALMQSQNMEHVYSAKMLYHWGHVMREAIRVLTEK